MPRQRPFAQVDVFSATAYLGNTNTLFHGAAFAH